MNYPELEINLHRRDTRSYAVEMRFRDLAPGNEAEQRAEAYPVRFNFVQLAEIAADSVTYGSLLGTSLLGHPDVRSCLDKARTVAQATERRLRLRLGIDRWSARLHGLRWETMRDPTTGRSLLTDDNILFSRYLGSFDMRPVRLRLKTQLRALVAVANPADLAKYQPEGRLLAPIDVAPELARAVAGLSGMTVTVLAGQPRATLDAVLDRLRDDYDILYLVCHGALVDEEPRLWLEDEEGLARVMAGMELVDGLARLVRLPRLVVLASCQSAGTGDDAHSDDRGALAALGPCLAEAGIPAVIAMQGNVLQRTVARFMPIFFHELSKDGQLDRAVAEARFGVRDAPDHWAPVLYTRLASGRLWYDRRFASAAGGFQGWPGLLNRIAKGKCVPVLGSGLLEPFIGSPREIGRRWALRFHYPMVAVGQYELPQIAQYLSLTQGPDFPRDRFAEELTDEVLRRWPDLEAGRSIDAREQPSERLLRLLAAARHNLLAKNPADSHLVLSRLDCPIYLTTNPDSLLTDALRADGKTPREVLCRWHEDVALPADALLADSYTPTAQEPLVFQLFGHLIEPDSVVLTEDDYFNYLIGFTRMQNRPQPSVVLEKLTTSTLMFLGFKVDDWDFRVFIHLLTNSPAERLRRRNPHIAVQLDPEEGLGADPDRARSYLEEYFHDPKMQMEIYWGSAEDFLQELNQQRTRQP